MSRPDSESRPLLSVFNRLMDDHPRDHQEVPPNRFQAVREYKEAVARDLEWLLNTRANAFPPGEEFPELGNSVYCFGLPDFSNIRINSTTERQRLARAIQQAIELHEPRLSNVAVDIPEVPGPHKLTVRFTVTALLEMTPAPEQIAFDTELEVARGAYKIKGE